MAVLRRFRFGWEGVVCGEGGGGGGGLEGLVVRGSCWGGWSCNCGGGEVVGGWTGWGSAPWKRGTGETRS